MNRDRVEGQWKQIKGRLLERWGRLTDDDLDVIEGRREQLAGRIQERYGVAREEAEAEVQRWRDTPHDDDEDRGGNGPTGSSS